jgi:hypothetical protein
MLGAERPADVRFEVDLLARAGIGMDGPSLLEFLAQRVVNEQRKTDLVRLVNQLGAPEFSVREAASHELVEAGRPALKPLLAALTHRDLEIATRAGRCLEELERGVDFDRTLAVLHVLATVKPAGSVGILLDYFPHCEVDCLESAVLETLAAIALSGGKVDRGLIEALDHFDPKRRSAAALLVARCTEPANRDRVKPLLRDPSPLVRARAGLGLAMAHDRDAIPVVVEALTDTPMVIASEAEALLIRLAGETAPATLLGDSECARRRCRDAWAAWWKAHGARMDLAPLGTEAVGRGATLIADFEAGIVWEADSAGKERWRIEGLDRPSDAHWLPAGRVLIAEHGGRRVTERDRFGQVIWEFACASNPVSCQRLPNGNTFVATYEGVLEVSRQGRVLFSWQVKGETIFNALRLRDGRILLTTNASKLREIDAEGKEHRTASIPRSSGWSSIDMAPNGNLVLALYSPHKVVELDASGAVVWQAEVKSPTYAKRLPNGNTLVTETEANRVVEFDPAGKIVATIETKKRPFRVRRD